MSRVTDLPHAAQCNKAPFMYEMKGALSGYAARLGRLPAKQFRSAGFPASPFLSGCFPVSPRRLGRFPAPPFPVRLVPQLRRFRLGWFACRADRGRRLPVHPGAARRPPVPSTRGNTGFPAFPASRGNPRDGARFLR